MKTSQDLHLFFLDALFSLVVLSFVTYFILSWLLSESGGCGRGCGRDCKDCKECSMCSPSVNKSTTKTNRND